MPCLGFGVCFGIDAGGDTDVLPLFLLSFMAVPAMIRSFVRFEVPAPENQNDDVCNTRAG